ncbi:MAG TPA: Bax inhibitor-1/YccA family protein [Vitreimonas sp.]|jgi:FtsH-binding integral membrane protein|nr:Bax inhibitor-1/YccA family protein [Vitreimonas sp.]
MSDYHPQARTIPAGQADMSVDAGLRGFMLGVYNKMALGLLLSAGIAYGVATTGAIVFLLQNPILLFAFIFAPLVLIIISSWFMKNPSPTSANVIYWGVVATMGVSLGLTVFVYAADPGGMFTIVKALLVTCATFGALSLWGYTTKRDLSGFGTFLYMGVIGIIIAMVVNFFLHSSALDFAITVIGVLIFSGLTAFKTQQIKWSYYQLGGDARAIAVGTTYAALSLYITFINLFLFVLRLMGGRR